MEILHLQKKSIYDQLERDYALLSELEDDLRTADDPKKKIKIRGDIEELKEQISARVSEFESLQNKDFFHSPLPQHPETATLHEPLVGDSEFQQPQIAPSTNRKQTGNRQIGEALEALSRSAERENSESENVQTETLDDFHLLRLQLLVSAKLASTNSTSMLGRHEVNRLYLSRDRLRPTSPELTSLLRLLIHDYSGYVPGWYWFKDFEAAAVESVVVRLAFSDQENSVRQQAFELLAAAQIPLPGDEKENVSWTVTSDSSTEVRRAALTYLGQVGGLEYLPIVHSALADRERAVLYQATVSKYLILARTDGDRALSELLGESGLDNQDLKIIVKELSGKKHEIASTSLAKTLIHPNGEIKLLGVEELIARGELSVEDAAKLKKDADDAAQSAIFRFLVEKGVEIEPYEIGYKLPNSNLRFGRNSIFTSLSQSSRWNEIVLSFYRRYDFDRLLELSDWNKYPGFDAHRALAIEHFAEFGERLRTDLRDDFAPDSEKYYQKQLEEWRELNKQPETLFWGGMLYRGLSGGASSKNKREPEESAKDSVESHKKYYIAAALAGLLENGSPADAEFGRRFLFHADADVRIEALKILRKWGSESDVPDLIKIARSSDVLVQELAAQAALTVTENREEVARELLKIGDEVVISIAVSHLIMRAGENESSANFLKEYLYSEDENVRTRVMAFFALKYDSKALTELLEEYTTGGEAVYYYDVVCCFDRILYAPANLHSYYNKTLKSIFFGLLDD